MAPLPSLVSIYCCNLVNIFFYVLVPDLPARLQKNIWLHFMVYYRCKGYLLWGMVRRFTGSFQITTPCSATRDTVRNVPPRRNIRHLCQTMTASVTTTWNLMPAILSSPQVSNNFLLDFEFILLFEQARSISRPLLINYPHELEFVIEIGINCWDYKDYHWDQN